VYGLAGFYAGIGIGETWARGSWAGTDVVSLSGRDPLVDAFKDLLASHIAYNIYFGYLERGASKWAAGWEADYAYINVFADPGIPGTGAIGSAAVRANDSVTFGAKWSAALRARVGYLITPSTLAYIAAGPSLLSAKATVNCTAAGVCGTNGITPFSQTNSTTKFGWTLGGGVEQQIWGNWRGRAEYRYADYGKFSTNFGTPTQLALAADIKVHTHTIMVSALYNFSGLNR